MEASLGILSTTPILSSVRGIKELFPFSKFRASQSNDNSSGGQDNTNNKLRLLLVDDEADILFTFKIGLKKKGFDVDAYTDPKLALENFKPNKYDILITDVRMPKINGFELYRKISRLDSQIKVFFLSAIEVYGREVELAFPHLRQDSFIRKPIGIDDLSKLLRKHSTGEQEHLR